MGVPEVWIFDPIKRILFILREVSFEQFTGDTLRLEGTPIEIDLPSLFAVLDL